MAFYTLTGFVALVGLITQQNSCAMNIGIPVMNIGIPVMNIGIPVGGSNQIVEQETLK